MQDEIIKYLDLNQFLKPPNALGLSSINLVTMNLFTTCLCTNKVSNIWKPGGKDLGYILSVPNFEEIKSEDLPETFENVKKLLNENRFSKSIKSAMKANKDSSEIEIILDLELEKEKTFFYLRSFTDKRMFKPFQQLRIYYNPDADSIMSIKLEKFKEVSIRV